MYTVVNAISLSSGGGLIILKSFIQEIVSKGSDVHYYIYVQEEMTFQNTDHITFIHVAKKGKVSLFIWNIYGFFRDVKK